MSITNHNRRSPSAVVVNDDPTQLNLLSGLLDQAGLHPRAFTNAEAALAAMSTSAGPAEQDPVDLPALIVTDLYMPGIDGWRFCRLLRSPEYPAFNQVPILVVSATFAGDEPDRIAVDLGAEAFLPSPVDGQRFVQKVRAILNGEQARIPLRVLIVDDNAPLCHLLQEAFTNHGYEAETALTIQEAEEAFGKTDFEVAVLDYHLPDGSSDILLERFHERRPNCVCLMMTSDTGPELALAWMKRGAAAYLRKPFQAEYLIELCAKARRERALLRVQDLLEVRTCQKDQLEAQLQQAQKLEAVGRLAGGVAHDFNNMLGVILGHVDMAIDLVGPAQPLHEDLAEIRKAALRSADLTRQLLAFARQQTIAPKVLDLNEIVESLLKLLRRLIGEDIHLAWLPAASLWPVMVDPTQIDQILANLCVNARDAIRGVGQVTIETKNVVFDAAYCASQPGFLPGEYIQLTVSDTGCGMDKSTRSHLFEPFFTTKQSGEGTGLGLATVYGIVKQNHGYIHVDSEAGQGATFKIYLPRHEVSQVASPAENERKLPLGSGETVMIVEDEPTILGIARRILDRLGYTVLSASTPGEAIRQAEAHTGEIHLLVTDVVMPDVSGRDLAKRLMPLYPQLRCLFMSGYTANVIAPHGVLEKGMHFIQKPFSMKDLAAKVRQALDADGCSGEGDGKRGLDP